MRFDVGSTLAAVVLTLAVAGCSETGHPVAANEMEAVMAAAPNLSLGAAIADLGLSGDEMRHVEALVGELHTTMMAAHESMGDVEQLDESERAALHESLQGQMAEIHERHQAVLEILSEDQRTQFMENIHRQMQEHGEHGEGEHEGEHGGDHDGPGHS
ncbi:MAG: hypothetical protein ACR2QM_01595 [Longimicrobiales bacterium]